MTATETLSSLRSAIKSNPNDLVARAALADAYEEQGKPGMAAKQRRMIETIKAGKEAEKKQREEYRDELRKLCPKGSTVYSIVRNVSRSGMQRRITFYAVVDNEPRFLDGLISNAMGVTRSAREEGLIVNGCGMDMCFHIVHNLGYVLYQDGYALNSRTL